MKAYQRLLSYVKISTPSNEESSSSPSSQCQFDLALLLVEELKGLGISDKDPFHRPGSLLLFFIHYASLPLIRFVFLACTRFTPNRIRNDTASVTSAIAVALS